MDFPDVPFAAGVPNVARIPSAAINMVNRGLDQVAGIMNVMDLSAINSPSALLSSLSPQLGNAQSIMSGVTSTVGIYGASTLFTPFVSPVAGINSSLSGIAASIAAHPTNAVSTIAPAIGAAADLTDATATDFDTAVNAEADPSLDGVESVTVTADRSSPQWGLFKDGKIVIEADNVASFDYKREWAVADYPLEKGAFESYNKVQFPFDIRLRMSKGGSVEKREAFIKAVEAIDGTLDLYDVVTPEKTYLGCNIQHVDYRRRNDQGVGLITVDLYLIEIRDTATTSFAKADSKTSTTGAKASSPASPTATKSPTAAAKTNNGPVQPLPLTAGSIDPFGAGGIL